MDEAIRQIMPATGWRAVWVQLNVEKPVATEEPLVCFALLAEPVQSEDSAPQLVVPMIRERGINRGLEVSEIRLATEDYWRDELANMRKFIAYLGPGEQLTDDWVRAELGAAAAS